MSHYENSGERKCGFLYPDVNLLCGRDKCGAECANSDEEYENMKTKLGNVLKALGVSFTEISGRRGPTVTRFQICLKAPRKSGSVLKMENDIAFLLNTVGVRCEIYVDDASSIAIEMPNETRELVPLRTLIDSDAFRNANAALPICIGTDAVGEPVIADLARLPHLLVGGATGAGKTVFLYTAILSLLYRFCPQEVRLIAIDPKTVEFRPLQDLPHLLVPPVNDPKDAVAVLQEAINEMERRYEYLARAGVRNIDEFRQITQGDPDVPLMPRIVILIEELADLMLSDRKNTESALCRLAQKSRAAGIHLIIGMQRPSVDVLTGIIKANIPSRIAFAVPSQIASRTLLDARGAEKLLGRGDMLYSPIGTVKPRRVQGAYVSSEEMDEVVRFLIRENGTAEYEDAFVKALNRKAKPEREKQRGLLHSLDEDPKLEEAIAVALWNGKISTSLLQRKLKIGYGRACKLIDCMEELGVVDAANGSKSRPVLMTAEEYRERFPKAKELAEKQKSDASSAHFAEQFVSFSDKKESENRSEESGNEFMISSVCETGAESAFDLTLKEDEKLDEAIALALENGTISTSLLQRKLKIGYGRAASLIDKLQERGIVSLPEGNRPRKALMTAEEYRTMREKGGSTKP